MTNPRPPLRKIVLWILVVILIVGGCTAESPTRPEPDPLVGSWEGYFLSPIGGSLGDEGFTLTVQGGGEGVGTGRYWYSYFGDQIMEMIFLEVEVGVDGSVRGTGTWICAIMGFGGILGEGRVTGTLDAETLTGSGVLRMEDPEGTLDIVWEVSKPDM